MKTKQTHTKKTVSVHVRHHAKRTFVPHKENQYRPHLIRLHGLVAVLIIALAAQMTYSFATTGQLGVLGKVSNVEVPSLFVDTNEERVAAGLPELELSDELSQAATLKAQNMFEEQYWSHVAPDGTQPWKWFGDVGYNYAYAGENLAKNYPTAEATTAAWMASDAHRENILKPEYVDVGFAALRGQLDGRETTIVVALYGTPAAVAAVNGEQQAQPVLSASPVSQGANNPVGYFASSLSALSPVTIAILGILAVVGIVGVAAHHYRNQLPRSWRKSWRVHHGMYTFVGTLALGVLIIIATGGGSI